VPICRGATVTVTESGVASVTVTVELVEKIVTLKKIVKNRKKISWPVA
jgi:hypothetical protein